MMKRKILFLMMFVFVLFSGCAEKDKPALKIGKITVMAGEFEEEFKNSRYSADPSGRQAFLNELIRKKLILNEAEKMGLDKNPQFLKDIQFYWEQGLLKLVLDRKTKELMSGVEITDQDIQNYYQARRNTDFAGTELSKVYNQIKWFLLQEKQSRALDQWVAGLGQRIPIQVDDPLLKDKNGSYATTTGSSATTTEERVP